ncbi:hypothetical protein CJF30_00007507 [Rutstroemia sp. NJR-2017a BBW]|nr:hypothetical protein CJF30_00007507 [Rutstroemia sp. NJR-2017a BBW]
MKSIATIGVGILALCGVSFAQVTYNSTTGQFICALPNASYCASVSLGSPIIIRCSNGIGQPGNCNDNLAGEFPYGVSYSPCWESSNVSGDAACSKNSCIVYGGSGNFNGTFTLPNCTAIPSTTIPTPPTIPIFTPTGSSIPYPTVNFPSGTAVGTGGSGSGGSGSGGGGSGGSGVNGTSPNGSGGSGGSGGATVTPVGPSKTATGTGPAQYTNDASRVGLGMGAILGGVVAGLML